MVSQLVDLKQRLEALPTLRQRAQLLGQLKKYSGDLADAAGKFAQAEAANQRLAPMFDVWSTARFDAAKARVRQPALDLRDLLRNDVAAVGTQNAESRLRSIREQALSARTAVRDEWRARITAVILRFREIQHIADAAALPGAGDLSTLLSRVAKWQDDLPSPGEYRKLQDDLTALERSVASLSINDKAGRFLQDVVSGRGDARALLDPEIRAFLDERNLWTRLAVRFAAA